MANGLYAKIGAGTINIDYFVPYARVSVKRMAETAKDFHHAGWTSRAMFDGPAEGAKVGQLEYML